MSDIVEPLKLPLHPIIRTRLIKLMGENETLQHEIEKLRAALREIECSHIADQPAAFDCTDLDWARRHVGKLRLIARAALGEKE
jgi:regulator of replication initiation timing